jgi:hypothetical protein
LTSQGCDCESRLQPYSELHLEVNAESESAHGMHMLRLEANAAFVRASGCICCVSKDGCSARQRQYGGAVLEYDEAQEVSSDGSDAP